MGVAFVDSPWYWNIDGASILGVDVLPDVLTDTSSSTWIACNRENVYVYRSRSFFLSYGAGLLIDALGVTLTSKQYKGSGKMNYELVLILLVLTHVCVTESLKITMFLAYLPMPSQYSHYSISNLFASQQ
ncbi:hypothetical protein SCHPADRAFT_943994 [Schizopora paradoxa]|uniref:Uncharacterized protein n=1 Tax=Schizopora paradoxa TaxID=27342 RepID=A0A0H2RW10_9AGAM|nr:hypothetical protein SCHPADRAFT_943994 [Schizopora paradoxa]